MKTVASYFRLLTHFAAHFFRVDARLFAFHQKAQKYPFKSALQGRG